MTASRLAYLAAREHVNDLVRDVDRRRRAAGAPSRRRLSLSIQRVLVRRVRRPPEVGLRGGGQRLAPQPSNRKSNPQGSPAANGQTSAGCCRTNKTGRERDTGARI
jgi:hypothetical protein